jgi:hypothetical protein
MLPRLVFAALVLCSLGSRPGTSPAQRRATAQPPTAVEPAAMRPSPALLP